ncbi:MAG: translocation/assembly module TamB domain-containing protein [Candidatus Paracaedibacteraceae bacterium]|nr:translocation/assembly module TamB domain-containing protein [Candidatus Paracaedibacteraceae bacterium]
MKVLGQAIKISFVVFRALCLCALLLGIALQFAPIQTYIINTFVLNKSQSIKIDGFSGLFPFYFSFNNIELYENANPILAVKKLDLNWSLKKFILNRFIEIYTLDVDQLDYYENQSTSATISTSNSPPIIPFGYVSNINIRRAQYHTAKHIFRYALTGETSNKETGVDFKLQLTNLHQKTNVVQANVSYAYGAANKAPTLNINLSAKETNGLLAYLIPNLSETSYVNVKGQGELNSFKGILTTQFGNKKITANVQTSSSENPLYINIFSNVSYTEKDKNIKFSGTVKTTQDLEKFTLNNCDLKIGNQPSLKLSGDFFFVNNILSSKTFTISIPIATEYTLKATTDFSLNTKKRLLTGKTKSTLYKGKESIFGLDVPFSLNKTFESLQLHAEGKGSLPLSEKYKEYALITLKAKIDPNTITQTPTISFSISGNAGNIAGNVVIADVPKINLSGEVLSNIFHIETKRQNGHWLILGKNASPKKQPWSIDQLSIKLDPQQQLKITGEIKGKFEDKNVNIEIGGNFDSKQQVFNMDVFRAIHKETFIEGNGTIDITNGDGHLDWHFYTFNLGDLFPYRKTAGTASILGQLVLDQKDPSITFSGDFHKLIFDNLSAQAGNISGSIMFGKTNTIQLTLNAKKATAYNTIIEEFNANTNGALDHFSTTISMTGFAEQALRGNLAFSILNLNKIELDTAAIQLGHHKILLAHPTQIYLKADNLIIGKTKINTTTGTIDFSGKILPETIDLQIALEKVSSDLLYNLTSGKYPLKGDINGTLHAYGQKTNPSIRFSATTQSDSYSTEIIASLDRGSLTTDFSISSNDLQLTLHGSYPVQMVLQPFNVRLDPYRPFSTNLMAQGKIDKLHKIFDLNYDKFSGEIDANLSLYGTIDNQDSKGHIKIKDGGYTRENIGLKLHSINFNLATKKGQFFLTAPATFEDHQNHGGNIQQFKFGIGHHLTPYLNADINFTKVHFIDLPRTRRGGMSAFVSGNLKIDGPLNALKIYMRGDINSFEKYIGEDDEVPIYHAKVEHQHQESTSVSAAQKETKDSQTTYDIDLTLDRKFHIYGQGLDSNWKGRLVIEGTSNNPIYKGQFILKDGQLRILDRFFNVQRGEVYFDGTLSPDLYIESQLNLEDMRVKIILEGDATNLRKKIVSDKNLSEQEILQRLFFNRSSTVSQSFQALNYFASSSFISSFINLGFYQEEDPLTHLEREYVSIRKDFSKNFYGKVDISFNNTTSSTDKVSVAAGAKPFNQTKTELTFSPDKNKVGISLEWGMDF